MKKMKKIIEDLAISDGIYDCICDPYDKFKTGDEYGSVMYDLERFAEKIIRECANQCTTEGPFVAEVVWGKKFHKKILEHFGIE